MRTFISRLCDTRVQNSAFLYYHECRSSTKKMNYTYNLSINKLTARQRFASASYLKLRNISHHCYGNLCSFMKQIIPTAN